MKKIIIFGGIGLVVIILAVVGVVIFLNQEDKPEEIVYSEFPLGEQYTNIAVAEGETPARKPVLKYSPVIQYTNAELDFTPNTNLILTEFRKYFMSRNANQLSKLDRVQEDLVDITIEIMGSDPDTITNVFFIEFIIQ